MLRPSAGETLRAWLLSALVVHGAVAGNPDAKRLYDDLLSNYNKLVRPVVNTSDVLRVCIKLKLSQLIDVLSSKSGLSNRFSELQDLKRKNSLKNERDVISFWNSDPKMRSELNRSELEVCHLCPYGPYFDSCEGIHNSIITKDVAKECKKKSRVGERCHRSKLISNALKEDSTNRKNSSSRYVFKSRRKSHKFNRSEACSKKFKHLDSMKEFRRILENFKIFNEDFDEYNINSFKESGHIVPAYFVLKLLRNPRKDLIKREEAALERTDSLKLIFANDDPQVDSEEKSKVCFDSTKSSHVVKSNFDGKGKNNDIWTNKCSPEDLGIKRKENVEVKHCLECIKIVENFKLQREFNSELLEQIKRIVSNLTTMTGLFNDLINSKTEKNEKFTENISQDFSKIKESSEKIVSELNAEISADIEAICPLHSDTGRLGEGSTEYSEYWKFLKSDLENISKDVWTIFTQKKQKDVLYLPQAESARTVKAHLQKKNESSTFNLKSKCHCHIKSCCDNGKKAICQTRRKSKYSKQKMPKEHEFINTGPKGKRDHTLKKKNLSDEENKDSDYEETDDEMENIVNKTGVEVEVNVNKLTKKEKVTNARMERLDSDQVRLPLEYGDFESNIALSVNEYNEEQLSSRATSRMILKKNAKSQKKNAKPKTVKKSKCGCGFGKLFSKKKSAKSSKF